MLKPLTLSLSLALALSITGVSQAQLFGGHASPQCPAPSAQCAPSPQCASPCAPKKSCFSGFHLPSLCQPKCYTYTWVLKKKRVWNCGTPSCGTYASSQCVTPSGQGGYVGASGQGGYAAPQAYGVPQHALIGAPSAAVAAAPAPAGDEAPPAPEIAPTTPAAPVPAAPAPANGPQSSLLFSTPSGN